MEPSSKKDILEAAVEDKLSAQLFWALNSSSQDEVLVASLTLLAKVRPDILTAINDDGSF